MWTPRALTTSGTFLPSPSSMNRPGFSMISTVGVGRFRSSTTMSGRNLPWQILVNATVPVGDSRVFSNSSAVSGGVVTGQTTLTSQSEGIGNSICLSRYHAPVLRETLQSIMAFEISKRIVTGYFFCPRTRYCEPVERRMGIPRSAPFCRKRCSRMPNAPGKRGIFQKVKGPNPITWCFSLTRQAASSRASNSSIVCFLGRGSLEDSLDFASSQKSLVLSFNPVRGGNVPG